LSRPVFTLGLRLRLTGAIITGVGLIVVLILVGSLFPSVGHTIGQLNVPESVANLLGGADYGTVTGWFRGEMGAIYGPLLAAALAITGASATIAGEEEDHILALVLAYPIRRSHLVAAKACAIAIVVVIIAVGAWIGLLLGVAAAGGGISVGNMAALSVHLAFFGFASGAVAVAVAAGTGRRALATGVASAVGILGWLVNSFAPLVSGLGWMKYLSPYYYYASHDPLSRGIGIGGLVVLGALAIVLTAVGMVAIERRDLRG